MREPDLAWARPGEVWLAVARAGSPYVCWMRKYSLRGGGNWPENSVPSFM